MARFINLRVRSSVLREVDPEIFQISFAENCMTHKCQLARVPQNDIEGGAFQDDACCRYGCDVFLPEIEPILRRASQISAVLDPAYRDAALWLDYSDIVPGDKPELTVIRTRRQDMSREDGRCIFLGHDQRGCALHRAALTGGFAPEEIKPLTCRLYPLSVEDEVRLCLADDVHWYSCARSEGPSIYQVQRETIREAYGEAMVAELDELQRIFGKAGKTVKPGSVDFCFSLAEQPAEVDAV